MAKVYNYSPNYPIRFEAGSSETGKTAWPKVISEFENIYRLLNEQLSYYESMSQELQERATALEERAAALEDTEIARFPVGTIVAYNGDLDSIPDGWSLCDGSNGTPNLTGKFLEGVNVNAGSSKSAGLPNIIGAGNSETYEEGGDGLTGAFYRTATSLASYDLVNSDNKQTVKGGYSFAFDASRSNSIYGQSSTVQPASYTVYYIMRVS